MLKSLYIENIILIEKCLIQFSDKMTCITGDSGSGKSIILDSLGIILGERASQSVIRDGFSRGVISAEFDISKSKNILEKVVNSGYATSGLIIIKKIINKDQSSKILLNDQPTSVSFVKELMQNLIQVHGQTDQLLILDQKQHRKILDDCIDKKSILKDVRASYFELKAIESKMLNLERELDLKKMILQELNEVQEDLEKYEIYEGEEGDLFDKRVEYLKSEKVSSFIDNIVSKINTDSIRSAISGLSRFNKDDAEAQIVDCIISCEEKLSFAFEEISIVCENLSNASRLASSEINFDISKIENRLEEINEISRKYRVPSGGLFNFIRENQEKINDIHNLEKEVDFTKIEFSRACEKYFQLSNLLHEERKSSGFIISKSVNVMLKNLEMQDSVFEIVVDFNQDKISEFGSSDVVFVAMLNKGTKFSPINEIASGGEISRLILAIKSAISSKVEDSSVLIFDEIESGLSANVSVKVSQELLNLSNSMQIIAITHNPYIAGVSDFHIKVTKSNQGEATRTVVEELDLIEKRQTEIAKMISFDQSENAMKMALGILNCGAKK